ncbi:MAG: ATP-binding cassette domain-containing protein, partial [Herbiconiux sp.]|nr:ATP-binding cassette domain-containing protein [Herbiconiux sp.]
MSAAAGEADTITLHGVGKVYPGRGAADVTALSGIELSIRRGEFVTLFGPSGCGKSTLLRILAGLEPQTTGQVHLFGQTPKQASADKNIAWVPQSSALLPWLTVRQNAQLSTRVNRAADRRAHTARQAGDADAILGAMGLADRAD